MPSIRFDAIARPFRAAGLAMLLLVATAAPAQVDVLTRADRLFADGLE